MVSAFWHGFYPNYYIFFFFAFMVEQCFNNLNVKTNLFEYIDSTKNKTVLLPIYIFSGFASLVLLNCLGIFFALTTFEEGVKFLYNVKFIPYIMIIILLVVTSIIPNQKKSKEKSESKLKSS